MLLSFLSGMYIDNRFCPRVRIVDGELKISWADKNKANDKAKS